MKLREYLAERQESAYAFSRRSGLPQVTVHRYVNGAGASLRNGLIVHEATDGLVTLEDLLPAQVDTNAFVERLRSEHPDIFAHRPDVDDIPE